MINYGIIDHALTYYQAQGFQRVESPWTVTREISDVTKPAGKKDFELVHEDGKVLVASGEQSFLYLYAKGFLPKGRFVTCTPCWRREPITQPGRSKYFMKAELIQTDRVSTGELKAVIESAMGFFNQHLPQTGLKIIGTGEDAFDIEFEGTELGSYGIRQCNFLTWIYGTGVAEPRLSQTIEKHKATKIGQWCPQPTS